MLQTREAGGIDGIHDLGGMEGFGPVEWSRDEPVFAEDWERGAFRASMNVMAKVQPNGGAFRHSIERMDPAQYLSSSYYEHWLTGAASLLVESGLVSQEELERRANGRFPLSRPDRGAPPAAPAPPCPPPTPARTPSRPASRWATGCGSGSGILSVTRVRRGTCRASGA